MRTRTPELILGLVALAGVYYGAAELGTSLAFADNATAVWLPAGIGAAAVLLIGWQALAAVALGQIITTIVQGTNVWVGAALTVGNVAEAAIVVLILNALIRRRVYFRALGELGALLVAAPVAAAVSATLGATALLANGDISAAHGYWLTWQRWLVADFAAIALIVPIATILLDRTVRLRRQGVFETAAVATGLVAMFVLELTADDRVVSYVAFPVLMWVALRFGRKGAAGAALVAAAGTVIGVATMNGPFVADTSESTALLIAQTYAVVAAMTSLALAMVDEQRAYARRARDESAAQLTAILDASPSIIFFKDLAGRYKVVSHELQRRMGVDWTGLTDDDVLPAEQAARVRANDAGVAAGGRPVVEHEVVRTPDGGDVTFRSIKFPVVGPDGTVAGVGGVAHDVTAELRVERELRRSERLLARTAELGAVGGWEVDLSTRELRWSEQLYAIHGVDPATFEPTLSNWVRLTHPDDYEESRAIFESVTETGSFEHRRRIVRPDGNVRVVLGRGTLERDADGKPVRVVGFEQDITELAVAEAELRRKEELLERTSELGHVGGWELDRRSGDYIWSDQMYEIYGVDPETFVPSDAAWRERVHPDDVDRTEAAVRASIAGAGPWNLSTRIVRPDGEMRILRSRGDAHFGDDGRAIRVVGFEQDITEQVRADEELHRAKDLLDRTAALGQIGGWEEDLTTHEITWSEQQYAIHGQPRDFEINNETWLTLVHPDDRQMSVDAVTAAVRAGEPWEFRRRIIRPDGEVRVLMGRGSVHHDADGRPVRLTGFDQDITALAAAQAERRRTRAMLERIAELGQVGGWEADARRGTIEWSKQMYRIYGVPEDFEITPESWAALSYPDAPKLGATETEEAIRRGGTWDRRLTIRRPDGEVRTLRSGGQAELGPDGKPARVVGYAHDITDAVLAEEELRLAEERYRRLVERLPAVSYVVEAGPGGAWRYVSPQVERMLGYTPEQWSADPDLWVQAVHPDDYERVIEAERRAVATETPLAVEYRLQTRDGRIIWVRDEALVRREDGVLYLDGMLSDVTERKEFETQLQFLADHDPLTGLFNRRRFVEEVALETRLTQREGHPSTLVMIDLDNFKYVNDALGHRAGDVLIRGIAEVITRRLRDTDTLARLGGDEFAALLRGTGTEEAQVVVAELLDAIRERTHALSDEPVRVTASAGIVALQATDADAEELLAAADLAMYEAKQTGRDRVAVFAPQLQHDVRSGRSWADRIRVALEQDEFELFCQPIVDLRTDEVSQWEVLLRLRGDDGKVIAPDAFLPLAERFDLIQQIDRWVALNAIEVMEERLRCGERVRLEVNLSAKSLVDAAFMDAVEAAIAASTIDPADLIFEVTETAAIANMDEARAFSERLRRLGCGFALDDFGSGFASFYYLKHLPVDYVKIDGDFIRALTSSRVDQQVVSAMIAIAQALGQKTVAEFVGDQPTVELLRDLGIDYVQGYHLGVPVPVERLRCVPAETETGQPA